MNKGDTFICNCGGSGCPKVVMYLSSYKQMHRFISCNGGIEEYTHTSAPEYLTQVYLTELERIVWNVQSQF